MKYYRCGVNVSACKIFILNIRFLKTKEHSSDLNKPRDIRKKKLIYQQHLKNT